MATRSHRRQLLVAFMLMGLVGVLAALQYRWLGQVSAAERAELQSGLERRAREFSTDLQRDIGALDSALARQGAGVTHEATLVRALAEWEATARFPRMVSAVYRTRVTEDGYTLERIDTASATLVAEAWPESLWAVRDVLRFEQTAASGKPQMTRVLRWEGGPFFAPAAAFVFWQPQRVRFDAESPDDTHLLDPPVTSPGAEGPFIVALDRSHLESTVFPSLIDEHFGGDAIRATIVDGNGNPMAHRRRDATSLDGTADVDVDVPVFRPQPGTGNRLFTWIAGRVALPANPTDRLIGVRIEQQEVTREGPARETSGTWRLLLQHDAGSLDAAVAGARRRNLYLSFGILSVLLAAIALVVVNARRSERLAARQMEFVATVSHELRTPLAVIRSAAENISAGIVTDAAQTRQYGAMIETEGRRLTTMVEQVLAHAGAGGARLTHALDEIDVATLLSAVAERARAAAAAAGCALDVDVESPVPTVMGDEAALGSALENLIGNAIRHGQDGRWIGLSVRAAQDDRGDWAILSVSDRGRGLHRREQARIFEAFYRGRDAVARQVPGTGLGLNLVRRIAEEHGGRVRVASSPGAGATFELWLPSSSPRHSTVPL